MRKSLISGTAATAFALTFAFGAAQAYAQVPQTDPEVDPAHSVQTDPADMADTLEQASDDIDAVADELEEQMEDEADETFEPSLFEDEATDDETTEDMTDETIGQSDAVVCPEGTKAQEDGTCRVTDEWTPDD
ncbi:MAG: hypothetical protein WBG08_04190 [Litorimonas sp.]